MVGTMAFLANVEPRWTLSSVAPQRGSSLLLFGSKEIRHCPAIPVPNHPHHLRMESSLSGGWPLATEKVCRCVPDTWNMDSPQA